MADPIMKFTGTYFYANGKRKCAIARVRLYKGTGRIVVNNMDAADYFDTKDMIDMIFAPLILTKNGKNFDISVRVLGGGKNAQASAIRHGISKALVESDAEYRAILKPEGFLTRDSRIKERKKFGLRKARRAPQFSKR